MIDWFEPYSIDWKVFRVNEDTWDDDSLLEGVTDITIDKDCTDSVPLIETSTMTVNLDVDDEFEDGWYRLVGYVYQNGTYERVPIATMQYQITSDEVDYAVAKADVKGQSVLVPAQDTSMRNGAYVPKGADGAYWVWEQLDRCLSCPVFVVGNGFTLDNYVVYDSGDSVLSACWNVLDAGKWCLQIDGDGVVYILERPKEPSIEIGVDGLRLLMPTIRRSRGKAGVPNRYIARDGKYEEVAENNDPSSPSSYVNVGRWIDTGIDENPSYVDGESLWTYARRMLEELSTVTRTYDYKREYYPDLYPFDIIRAYAVEEGFSGDLRISKQKLEIRDGGVSVSETAIETIKLWRA